MRTAILLLTLFFMSFTSGLSRNLFVNGEYGNDENSGSNESKKFALKTISHAVEIAAKGDVVHVEGKHSETGERIVYKESIRITSDQFDFQIVGVNDPIIDGEFESSALLTHNGFWVYGNKITIKGFTIRNFRTNNLDVENISGAGIYLGYNTGSHVIENNRIENCNYGIFMDGTPLCKINGNKIRNISSINDDESWYDGTGILIYPSSAGIDRNDIGKEKGNEISNVDLYGICFGADSIEKTADLSSINNNYVKNAGEAGIALLNISGIVEVKQNVLENNNTALLLKGEHFDTFITQNKFKGSAGPNEIEVGSNYPGALLYDVWKFNQNEFADKTAAASNKRQREVIVTETGGFIRNDIKKAEQDVHGGCELEIFDYEQFQKEKQEKMK